MKCKYCGCDNLQWPENYKKGDRLFNTETGEIHTWDVCKSFKNKDVTTNGWIVRKCLGCGDMIYWNKNCKEKTKNLNYCHDCMMAWKMKN